MKKYDVFTVTSIKVGEKDDDELEQMATRLTNDAGRFVRLHFLRTVHKYKCNTQCTNN